ncbi:MAG: hypothetical protein E6R08_06220 [Nevskiaceae bacterium]|nr:MAG: hypothetical protein E6R08_06220 [Nevskiaceae bacterium]
MLKKARLIIDLQFGSTGKGLIAGYLAARHNPDTLITAWAANAGHTYIDSEGTKFVHTMLANGIVSKNLRRILIGPGSLINPDALVAEINEALALGVDLSNVKLVIHPHAAVIQQRHIEEEQGPMTKIGSTKKGVGAAAIHRIRRDPDDNNVAVNALQGHFLGQYVGTIEEYNEQLNAAEIAQIEGAQGYSLSMYHGMYPYTTSRDVTTAQIFADCGLPISWLARTEVIGTVRTFPIRVANRFDEQGTQIGYSGGCYPDQHEMAWPELGLEAELTTVTKLPRRIFSLSFIQLYEAMRINGVNKLFVNFANYLRTPGEYRRVMDGIQAVAVGSGADIGWIGFGPTDDHVIETPPELVTANLHSDRLMALWQSTNVTGGKMPVPAQHADFGQESLA